MGGVLQSTTSTALKRTTVHAQYNGKALGVVMLNNLVPIVLNVVVPGGYIKKSVLVFGKKAHNESPYEDFGVRRKCCRQVLLFNVLHYTKHYLTSDMEGPYTFNCCRQCGVSLKAACDHLVQFTRRREYSVDKYIYRASRVLQSPGSSELFTYRRGNC